MFSFQSLRARRLGPSKRSRNRTVQALRRSEGRQLMTRGPWSGLPRRGPAPTVKSAAPRRHNGGPGGRGTREAVKDRWRRLRVGSRGTSLEARGRRIQPRPLRRGAYTIGGAGFWANDGRAVSVVRRVRAVRRKRACRSDRTPSEAVPVAPPEAATSQTSSLRRLPRLMPSL